MTKEWRLSIPDPVGASSRYREVVGDAADAQPAPSAAVASASDVEAKVGTALNK